MGVDGEGPARNRGEMLMSVWVAPPLAFPLILLLALGWQLLLSSLPGPPDGRRED